MDPDAVAKAFVDYYYTTFDTNRAGLASVYQESSVLSFEGQKYQGTQSISGKLTGLPFQQCKHQINTVDCQPSGAAGGMLVFVSGNLSLPGEQHTLKFRKWDYMRFSNLNKAGGVLFFSCYYLKGQTRFYGLKNQWFNMFHLIPTQGGSFYVQNDIFRLNYA
uniref:NTF2 domain-containing protein n=1 Tax=Solanum lycopersicum TaxID=4081 RepID=A0A3Q7F190_SOLLC